MKLHQPLCLPCRMGLFTVLAYMSCQPSCHTGVLLGAGASGSVYKGRWRGEVVAIKVLQHDASTAAAITNETDLMMSFAHPNIVKAYHVVSYVHRGSHMQRHASTGGALEARGGTAVKGHAPPRKSKSCSAGLQTAPRRVSDSDIVPLHTVVPNSGGVAMRRTSAFPEDDTGMSTPLSPHTSSSGANEEALTHPSQMHVSHASDSYAYSADANSTDQNGWNDFAQTWLITEYCDGGTLGDAAHNGDGRDADGKPNMVGAVDKAKATARRWLFVRSSALHFRVVLNKTWCAVRQKTGSRDTGIPSDKTMLNSFSCKAVKVRLTGSGLKCSYVIREQHAPNRSAAPLMHLLHSASSCSPLLLYFCITGQAVDMAT